MFFARTHARIIAHETPLSIPPPFKKESKNYFVCKRREAGFFLTTVPAATASHVKKIRGEVGEADGNFGRGKPKAKSVFAKLRGKSKKEKLAEAEVEAAREAIAARCSDNT